MSSSTEGWLAPDIVIDALAALFTKRRRRGKGRSHSPNLTAQSRSSALMKRARLGTGNLRNLRSLRIHDLYKPFGFKFLKQRQQVAFATLRFNVILVQDGVAQLAYGLGGLR